MNPELGYKEFRTSKLIKAYIQKYLENVKFEDFSRTGFKFELPTSKKEI